MLEGWINDGTFRPGMRLIGQNGMAKVFHAGPDNIVKAVAILTRRACCRSPADAST